MKKVVILGGGFGGFYTFLGLRRSMRKRLIDVTLVSREDHFLFTPLLHEVVSDKIRAQSSKITLSDFLKRHGARFINADVVRVDTSSQKVMTDAGNIEYEILVVALGASVNFFGISGTESLLTLKTLADAQNLKTCLYKILRDSSRLCCRIVVIGGGATGVEITAEVADLLAPLRKNVSEIVLLEAMDDILPNTNDRLRDVAKRSLKKRGVEVRLHAPVKKVRKHSLELASDETISFDCAIWTAGVKAVDCDFSPSQSKSSANRLKVLPTLQLKKDPSVFALGDIVDGYPMTAQVTVAQAKIVARNINALLLNNPLSNFVYTPKGMLFSLGRWMAGAEVKTHLLNKVLYIWGLAAWWVWHIVYLRKIPGFRYKLRILTDWLRSSLQ
ncbi:FAD-dependent oxidoreductase [Patescibacteria group bacterium AH-259-L07]|nr:FAD-dependent oxidoreductase [Patescibacteria group bacterium AH-259-L07]